LRFTLGLSLDAWRITNQSFCLPSHS
jgi:hypothetical protein